MNNKIQTLKKQIKNHVPEIIVGTTILAGVAALAYLRKNQPSEMLLALTPEEWADLSNGAAAKITLDNGDLIWLAKEIHNP